MAEIRQGFRLRPVVLSAGVLALLAAVLGVMMGTRQAALSETEVINAYAARYVAETGGVPTDCAAVPGRGEVWLIIRGGGAGLSGRVFEVDTRGALVAAALGEPAT
ncbi:MAG: hypothetical protein HKN02_14260 [Rhodobacteraceae bacterium]|nr:hypothetical protein [Paracoccaceae bacterium]